ncbi:MFS transporter [Lactobacillus sp. DCY120]|uniref:MFS transporter n=1 Tax=Bombilactobacillus apium TaxID=2675299 RepID=A0A850R783_9LACO|nr:MFS transporter [Bombilactobacillus apium]NVY96512.1 MFS transporter [Bombilactobacillus apium]
MINFIKCNTLFSKLTAISLFSKIGDRLFYTTMLMLATSLPQANLAITIVSVSETVPLLLGFFIGSIADRQQHKVRRMIINSLLRSCIYTLMGFLLNYSSTFILIVIMASLNFLSDIFGNYSSALTAPFTKLLIKRNDMEQAQGLISVTSQLVNVLATFTGSLLLSFFLSQTVAFLNALIFLLVGILFLLVRKKLESIENKIKASPNDPLRQMITGNLKTIFQNKIILNDLFQLSLINGFFGGITPIFVLFLKDSAVIFFSKPITIAILSSSITIFMIIGSEISPKYLTKTSTTRFNMISNLFIIIAGIGFLQQNIYLILFSSSIIALALGIVSPRFSAKIINNYPAERLGGIVTTVNSMLVVIPPITALIFPILASLSLPFSYLCFIIYGITLLIISKLILWKS